LENETHFRDGVVSNAKLDSLYGDIFKRLRTELRVRHYSLRTEQSYLTMPHDTFSIDSRASFLYSPLAKKSTFIARRRIIRPGKIDERLSSGTSSINGHSGGFCSVRRNVGG